MKRVIIVGGLDESRIQDEFLEAVTTVKKLNQRVEITAALCGENLTEKYKQELKNYGVHRLLFYKRTEKPISYEHLAKQWKQHFSAVGANTIIFTENDWTTEMASRLAVAYETKAIFDVVALSRLKEDMYMYERQLPGQKIQAIEASGPVTICSLKPYAFAQEEADEFENTSDLEVIQHEVKELAVDFYEEKEVEPSFVQLKDADVIVAGGRGIQTKEAYALLENLAKCFPNSAVGLSGGAVDQEFFSEDLLIGQTGTKISPRLYFACGISGANQHTGGLLQAETIIAINPDPNASIFDLCDYGIVGNVEDVLPRLIGEIKEVQGSTQSLFI